MGDRVLATHPCEHRVVARLYRQMQVLGDRFARGHGVDQSVGQVPRMRGNEAQTRYGRPAVGAMDGVNRAQQLRQIGPRSEVQAASRRSLGVDVAEALFRRQIVAVAVDVLAQKGQFAIPGGSDLASFGDDVVERPAALRSAAERDDAVGAGLVAAVDDRQPGRDRRGAGDTVLGQGGRSGGGQTVGGADGATAQHRRCGRGDGPQSDCSLRGDEAEPQRKLGFFVGTKEHVDRRETAGQAGSLGFADAAPR